MEPSFVEVVCELEPRVANTAARIYLELNKKQRECLCTLPKADMQKALKEHKDANTLRDFLQHVPERPLSCDYLTNQQMGSFVLTQLRLLCERGLKSIHRGICNGSTWNPVFHGDGHPSNVQVCKGAWKLADFDRAQVYTKAQGTSRPLFTVISSQSLYGPPEARINDDGDLTSDLWSFGMMLLPVSAWLVGGPKLRADLEPVLQEDEDGESGFIIEGSVPHLSPLVVDYMRGVYERAREQSSPLAEAFQDFWIFLRDHVLVADRKKREGHNDIADKLIHALHELEMIMKKPTAEVDQFQPEELSSKSSRRSKLFGATKQLKEPIPTLSRLAENPPAKAKQSMIKLYRIAYNRDADVFEVSATCFRRSFELTGNISAKYTIKRAASNIESDWRTSGRWNELTKRQMDLKSRLSHEIQ
jgi:hypothetical protein